MKRKPAIKQVNCHKRIKVEVDVLVVHSPLKSYFEFEVPQKFFTQGLPQ